MTNDFPVDDEEEQQYTGFSSNEDTDEESDKGEADKKKNHGNLKTAF